MIRNLVYSNFGRGVLSIREDEIASDLMSVNTRQVKVLAFVDLVLLRRALPAALFAHVLQFINPRVFDIIKSTDILIMVYLGGIGSIAGSIIGATIYTVLLEVLRPLGVWRMVLHAADAGAADDLPAARHHGPARVPLVRARRTTCVASKLWRQARAGKEVADASLCKLRTSPTTSAACAPSPISTSTCETG